jgi:hypothetical protein
MLTPVDDETKRLREIAAKSAAVCADCFTPLTPEASVTIVQRVIGQGRPVPRRGTIPLSRNPPPIDLWIDVPVCLHCWLLDLGLYHISARGVRSDRPLDVASPFTGWDSYRSLKRLRCEGCKRPMRVVRQHHHSSRLPLRERCCCADCFHKATLRKANERRRVRHREMACEMCGKMFVPKQSTAKTCSNTCRQRLYRREHKQVRLR